MFSHSDCALLARYKRTMDAGVVHHRHGAFKMVRQVFNLEIALGPP
jgi:hypothetical protein